jgi:hypothetical protein
MATIWVAHEPRGRGAKQTDLQPLYDYAEANGFEAVKFIFSKHFAVSLNPLEALAVAENFAAGFDFGDADGEGGDIWCLAGGDPLAGVICSIALCHEAIEAHAPVFKSLRYLREGAYVPIKVPTGVQQ